MRRLRLSAVALLVGAVVTATAGDARAASETTTTTTTAPACTATSSTGSGAFFDLRPDLAGSTNKAKDYHAKGYDYGSNFTLNICGSLVEPVSDVVGIDKKLWANVSAYYMAHDSVYSIGSESMDLRSRGRKLVLQYAGGSPCDTKATTAKDVKSTAKKGGGDDDDKTAVRRKSTTISFLCDKDPGSTQASVSFVGADADECAYFFEARSMHACAHAEPHKPGSVGPGSVFGIILLIAVLVYVLGGVFYNRTVTNSRGWRQLPNYSTWAGIGGFISVQDMFYAAWSWCCRYVPARRGGGYSHLNSNASNRHRSSDAENRLIDQLDEEWED
ncbi:hypothetical protein L249_6541 [Ophiocordyceps polyrhachis-furcata BCC 54312]|uniref:MRH domain-containing protein n=1 Tax=Ophiocordyceps polyrhachis-furcata BCC 54312 TaxID=1330021 RepID=A0A367LLR1_9HYPO|nr:hypothetical protein L249_6541 [Ophiocordyceps polyrhachis-furcata BCC 54312]